MVCNGISGVVNCPASWAATGGSNLLHYRRRIQILHPNNFRSVPLFSCLTVLLLCFFFSILSARALEIPVFYLVSVHAFMLGFVSFFFQLRLLCNYGLFSDLLFARLTGCIDFGMLRYFHVSFAHCSLIFPLALRFSFLGYQFVLFILESCLIAMLRSGFYTIFWLPLGPVIVLLIKL